jgi:transglutaminase-like putative cysteine protease
VNDEAPDEQTMDAESGARRFRITHRTEYRYESDVSASYNDARLVPRTTPDQQVHAYELTVEPSPSDLRHRTDHFGNTATHLTVHGPHRRLSITASSEVTTRPTQPGPGWGTAWEAVRDGLAERLDGEWLEAREHRLDSPLVVTSPVQRAYASASFPEGRPIAEAVIDLCSRLNADIAYEPGATTIVTRPDDVLRDRRGVCQDLAHVAIGCCRSVGLAARYVSGYLETDPPLGGVRLVGSDASHAWLAVFTEGGWIDLDPTNDAVAGTRHITLAWGRDYGDVPPLRGVVYGGSAEHGLEVSVDVSPAAGTATAFD